MRSISYVILISLIFCFISANEIGAQENLPSHMEVAPKLSASPHTFELDISPGEVLEKKVKIFNQSDVAIPIHARAVDFSAKEDSGDIIFDEMNQDASISARKWIKIKNPDIILDPGETKEINFTIDVPNNAEPGGHYATLFLEPTLPSFYFKEGQPRAVPVIGVLFILSLKTLSLDQSSDKAQAEIVEFGIKPENRMQGLEKALASAFQVIPSVSASGEVSIVEKTPFGFFLRIKNNDIFHHRFEGKVIVYNIFGIKLGETEIKKTTILPGKVRMLAAEFNPEAPRWLNWLPASISDFLNHNYLLGVYQASLEIKMENYDKALTDSKAFWAFSWKLMGPVLLFLLLIMLVRKRIKFAFATLFRPKPKDEDKSDPPFEPLIKI